MKLSSGKPLERKDGRPIYTPGMLALGGALYDLPRHRFDRDKEPFFVSLMEALDLVPDDVLHLVGEWIDELATAKAITCQPRLAEIEAMCVAAMRVDMAVTRVLGRAA